MHKHNGHDTLKAFKRIGDGSWVCIDPITIDHPNGQMQFTAGTTLMPGTIFMGVELTAWLDEKAGVAG